MFKKILIANRGEIALRVMRACREMGIATVAVYSEADRDSLHVRFADERICIGSAAPRSSYLNVPSIITAAEVSGAEAIHPGYGFLSENQHFAEACESCGLKFIGPSSKTLGMVGDKSQTRRIMMKEGVPCIPGSSESVKNEAEALKIVRHIGYPVIIKASLGGGGKGMRVVQNEEELKKNFQISSSEAESAFGSSAVYLEKYISEPRHTEFQILADEHGNIVHLGERDCSIQRRHQKLIEESPSTAIDQRLRKLMGRFAIRAAKAVNYIGAGTVEFLLDKEGKFYFMEMNARVQVEHPVTEFVTGVDILKEQIKIAGSERLALAQEEIEFSGHAIECRINAEDTEKDFMPVPGKITFLHLPGGPGVRVDTHIYQGYQVSPYYDSLLAKLIVWGGRREDAIERMRGALHEFVIEGIPTTIPFHKTVMNNAFFRRGEISTNFIQRRINGEAP
ncbi:acetyl-CoA carboxylase biotin carboxylase subunit [Candidatus Desantisbacteria bacterium CG_4_10_14_0_8_um_filter_48_22]|uniref:Biotin carboxylase n=1 Tax=Candidatus Desantisbacteria bacterium CG_4_10_14_0_8_um_filter_48_22 TaxID=1974543 RepID=A0A2M7SB31_9BACT|nr:MAG: acetyl-CoA carboxylase biotin carboxylase subunit [Candidatus Desantisbacteria bacterium CG1_02_49_89]PIV55314.1 MAG: acetyl-CoA carboxylase biotin carboxylase subunit [Candidatus Desantisbacteria bacterium CG02_land_8_20_14_3_00_49_13]PIZ16669.1 MAG: acetyl-CoA carboxylase biotin carboxylase subunit [Candidatus Desantisbacteria bacterium CG_4_10_14_0_8_um_filter_48_22]